MRITFKTKKLEKQYQSGREAEKAYGTEVARKYIQRVNIIKQVQNIDELIKLPGLRCHPLKGNRKGQWSVRLTGFYRLIFTLTGKTLTVVHIEEVSKHYDD